MTAGERITRAALEWAEIDHELAEAQRALMPRARRNLIEARLEQAAEGLREAAREVRRSCRA